MTVQPFAIPQTSTVTVAPIPMEMVSLTLMIHGHLPMEQMLVLQVLETQPMTELAVSMAMVMDTQIQLQIGQLLKEPMLTLMTHFAGFKKSPRAMVRHLQTPSSLELVQPLSWQ